MVISEKSRDLYGTALETLGYYDPRAKESAMQFETERIRYWLSKGAQPSPTVRNLLIDAKVIEGVAKLPRKMVKKKEKK